MRVLLLRHPCFSGELPGAGDMLLNSHHFPKGVAFPFTQSWLGKKSLPIIQTLQAGHRGRSHMSPGKGDPGPERTVYVCVSHQSV